MDQANFKFHQADNVYGALFFQFPKVLMYGEKYRYLSSEAKLTYMVLKDRLEYSLRNHWVDEEGHVYFIKKPCILIPKLTKMNRIDFTWLN